MNEGKLTDLEFLCAVRVSFSFARKFLNQAVWILCRLAGIRKIRRETDTCCSYRVHLRLVFFDTQVMFG